ncbi:MAG: TorF family putative porin [Hyphomicrobium sp.]
MAVLVAATALAFVGPAKADEFGYSITLGATTDYVFRGISLSDEKPEAQGSIDFSYGQFYAGAWASGVEGSGFAPVELDLYAGWKPVVGQFTFDFGIIGYLYPSADDDPDFGDYYEFKAAVSTEIVKSLTGGVIVYYTPDQDKYVETYTVEGSLAYSLPQMGIFAPTVSGGVGYTEAENGSGFFLTGADEYTYWNAGFSLGVEKLTMDFRYFDTDLDDGLADERFVFTAKVTLP